MFVAAYVCMELYYMFTTCLTTYSRSMRTLEGLIFVTVAYQTRRVSVRIKELIINKEFYSLPFKRVTSKRMDARQRVNLYTLHVFAFPHNLKN